ncbi:MAG: respiratory nitrate reductase subunit gamma [Deltaproteobacteria bacterium]|nr:respiratory nitrate reductase subunit gamma [Deltaproteobacteria bacterium]
MLNNFLFIAFPYVAIVVFAVGCFYVYRSRAFKYSSLSSQFLEGNKLFWGVVPFHWGLLVVFLGHLIAFLFPSGMLMWNGDPVRLIILEATGFIFALTILVGLVCLIARRTTNPRVKMVTSPMDLVIEILLLVQVILGCWIALGFRWGSSWFAGVLSPYLWSILKFNPQIEAVTNLSWVIQLHVFLAFVILFLVPFTRLVHLLVAPFHYISRPYQVVMWNWNPRAIRDPRVSWSQTLPRNN